tara:strand:+ start:1369 stop:2094 length:726 start_codon:yes stop_codon:yes gene_type:complete
MQKDIHHKKFTSIVILTGAGISAESGIKTFRDEDGLWENHRVEDIASPEGFQRNPKMVYNFYNERRKQLLSNEVKPNRGHMALAQLENDFKGQTTLITQNVDDLHERAGSKSVLHMHGELLKMRCQFTNQVFLTKKSFDEKTACLCCHKPGALRPHIVWFGEVPFYMDDIQRVLEKCDLFLSIGTSGQVYPAAMFMQVARQQGALTIEINKDPTANSPLFDKTFHGKAGDILPDFISNFFA